jgi:hypothetical protein
MKKAALLSTLVVAVQLAVAVIAEAQQPKIHRIGYISSTKSGAFSQGLRDLGYVEGKNLVIIYPGAGKTFAESAAELVRLNVDAIVTGGATATRVVKEATTTIPIVFLQDPDPVGNGLVTTLARPAGNITGLSSMTADLAGKRLELLREILPKLSRMAVLGQSANAGNGIQLRESLVDVSLDRLSLSRLPSRSGGSALIVDEGDFRFSDEKAEVVKILNNGNVKGFPVLRSESNGKREFNPKAYHVFGPKLVATRGFFDDKALESRFLTEEMGQYRLRNDVPINLSDSYKEEALHIRNKLLLFRFRNLSKRKPAD